MEENKTFKNLSLNDVIYFVNQEANIPEIKTLQITRLYKQYENELIITTKKNTFYVKPNKNQTKNLFIKKSDALEAFETLCTKRIIEISKALGKGI